MFAITDDKHKLLGKSRLIFEICGSTLNRPKFFPTNSGKFAAQNMYFCRLFYTRVKNDLLIFILEFLFECTTVTLIMVMI